MPYYDLKIVTLGKDPPRSPPRAPSAPRKKFPRPALARSPRSLRRADTSCLAGAADVGKTCLVDRYLHGRFDGTSRPTVGAAFGAKTVHRNSTVITVGIWDTAGQERFESISKLYYRGAKAALVCFDLTNKASFSKVKFWVEELKAYAPECLIFLVGTKADLVEAGVAREVNEAELNKVNAPARCICRPHAPRGGWRTRRC